MDERLYHEKYLGFDDRECFETAMLDAGQMIDRDQDRRHDRPQGRPLFRGRRGTRPAILPDGRRRVISATLADRWPMAINSGALRPEIEYSLGKMGVRDRVSARSSRRRTRVRGKPDPLGYLLALHEALRQEPGLADLRSEVPAWSSRTVWPGSSRPRGRA